MTYIRQYVFYVSEWSSKFPMEELSGYHGLEPYKDKKYWLELGFVVVVKNKLGVVIDAFKK